MPTATRQFRPLNDPPNAAGPERTIPIGTTMSSRPRSPLRRELPRLVALMPAAVLMTLFFMAPAVWAIYASLTDRALLGPGAADTEFIGFDNYRRLWNTPDVFTF